MTTDVRRLITVFDALTPAEQQEAVVELLRRYPTLDLPALNDEALTATADALFVDLDQREADDAGS